MKLSTVPTKENILGAHSRIEKLIHRTPVLSSLSINKILGTELYFKCENFQKAGAFKFRGASNALSKMNINELRNGVATHSSGNHAAALALAASKFNSRAFIVMPETAPKIKVAAVKEYGGKIFFCEPTLMGREKKLEEVTAQTGAEFIHPYDNYDIIEGQATAAKELIDEIPRLDYIIAPIGGGGLLSGTSLSAEFFCGKKKITVVGAEPAGADDAFRSIRDGKIYPSVDPQTIADGLLTCLSERTFSIIKEKVSEIITVSDESIVQSMRMIWERMKIIIEPSAAVTLAVILENTAKFAGKKAGLILSGGNLDLDNLPWSR